MRRLDCPALRVAAASLAAAAAAAHATPPGFCPLGTTVLDPGHVREISAPSRALAMNVDGSLLAVGDSNFRNEQNLSLSGAVHILHRAGDSWEATQLLHAPDPVFGHRFGNAVAMSADGATLLIGARLDDDRGDNAGSAYVFTRGPSGFAFAQELHAPDAAPGSLFGGNLALSADGMLAIISAPNTLVSGVRRGKAYVFTKGPGGYVHAADLLGSVHEVGREFGFHLAMTPDASNLLIGAPRLGGFSAASGAVHWFTRNAQGNWVERQVLLPQAPGQAGNTSFGMQIDISGDGRAAIIGAPFDAAFPRNLFGVVYLFERPDETWAQRAALTDPESGIETSIGFGTAISTDGRRAAFRGPPGAVRSLQRQDDQWMLVDTIVRPGASGAPVGGFGDDIDFSPDDGLLVIDAHTTVDSRQIHLFDAGRCETCRPDLTGNGSVSPDDFFAYLTQFVLGTPIADWDRSGVVNNEDFFAYLANFAAGC